MCCIAPSPWAQLSFMDAQSVMIVSYTQLHKPFRMLAAPQIRCIEKSSVHNICSGQVIVTLATAVKELVENSIDAGANAIHVTFREYGAKAIEVSDNGKGISEENFAGLTLKHHTSKIQDFEDISDVSTFGFRGEALSSLCALGNFSVLTSTGALGTNLLYDKDGNITKSNHHARPKGTTVVIENLFHSLPVRHKEFLKNIKKEFHKAIDALQAYAMVSLNIRIHCLNIVKKRKQVIFSTQGKSTLKDNIIDVLGCSIFKNLVAIDFNESIFHVHGYISKPLPKHGRGSADKQYFFINGRPCDHEKLSKTVNNSFKLHEKFQYPICILVIDIAKVNIDVNVTPDKRKLFVDNENHLIEGLTKYFEDLFQKYTGVFIEQSSKVQLTLPVTELGPQQVINCNRLEEKLGSPKLDIALNDVPSIQFSSNNTKADRSINYVPKPSIEIEGTVTDVHYSSTNFCSSRDKTQFQDYPRNLNIADEFNIEIIEPVCDTETSNLVLPDITSSEYPPQHQEFKIDIIEPERIESCNEISHSNIYLNETKSSIESVNFPQKTPVNSYDEPNINRKRRNISIKCHSTLIKEQSVLYNQLVKRKDGESLIHFNHQIVTSEDAEKELDQQITKEMFQKMQVLGQFNLGFILVKLNGNLFIIDQHATDEKFRYETLRKETKIDNQKLICPKSMALNGAQEDLLLSYRHIFDKNGFTFSYDDAKEPGQRVRLTAVPRSKSLLFDESDVQELLWLLSEESTLNIENLRPSKVHRMFASRACRSAVMIGTALDYNQMRKIVDHMAEMEHPWNCPHGRPTMRHVVDLSRIS